ncbi:MAG: hypothetical protein NPIRA05_12150 [Nitrospirales bacterium]|nr:MAG: hypothetical protein NPIRA05_12150 [Nitrospirales bacterium]
MEQRRRFSKEFKREAVQMATGANLSIKQVAADLGLLPTCLVAGAGSSSVMDQRRFEARASRAMKKWLD